MTNASCADCGRIVAFRTQDPSEIAECRNCGIWVKRSAEMPGVAVSVKKDSSTVGKTALPPRKNETDAGNLNPQVNTQRSAVNRTSELPTVTEVETTDPQHGAITAATVYAAIRDLQKSVRDLRAGQKRLNEDQEALKTGQTDFLSTQKLIRDGQEALYVGQQQLFTQYQSIQSGQERLLDQIKGLPAIPVPEPLKPVTDTTLPVSPLDALEQGTPAQIGFHTTPFSSLKIPLIPASLADLDIEPQFTPQGTVPGIPAHERTNHVGLIENPLPQPPPYVEPVAVAEPPPTFEEAPAPTPAPTMAAVPEHSLPVEPLEPVVTESPLESGIETEADSFLTNATHDSPFKIEGPPDEPFSIAQDEPDAVSVAPVNTTPAVENRTAPFQTTPIPFGATEYTHEPCDIDDPFSEAPLIDPSLVDPDVEAILEESESHLTEETVGEENQPNSLSQQIADAKENQERSSFEPTPLDLTLEPRRSRKFPFLILLAFLALSAALVILFTGIFKKTEQETSEKPVLLELPLQGVVLPNGDERIVEAEQVAKAFLAAQSLEDVQKSILPVPPSLLKNFWEPLNFPTIEGLFQSRLLENERVEVDYWIKEARRPERLLPLVKIGNQPFRVDWKSYRECEDVTLDGLSQGPLSLDGGQTVDQGKIRTWIQSGESIEQQLELGNFMGYKLHDLTEKAVAFAVIRKDSPQFGRLLEALANTKIKHKGNPAIRAILEVKRIEKENNTNGKPARLEILEVLATDWRSYDIEADKKKPTVKSQSSLANTPKPSPKKKAPSTAPKTSAAPQSAQPQNVLPKELPNELPPVPEEGDPLSLQIDRPSDDLTELLTRPGETPLLGVSFD